MTSFKLQILLACLALFLTTAVVVPQAQAIPYTTVDNPLGYHNELVGFFNGQPVGTYDTVKVNGLENYDFQSYIYSAPSTFTPWSYPGATYTRAGAASGNEIAGHYKDATGWHGFLFDGSNYTSYTFPGGLSVSRATAVDGQTVVGTYYDNATLRFHGYLFNGTTTITVDYPGSLKTDLRGVSGGKVFGNMYDAQFYQHGFIYENSTYTLFDYPGASQTAILAVAGDIVVGAVYFTADHNWVHFLYDGLNFKFNDLSNDLDPRAISSNTVVGKYTEATGIGGGKRHGFIAVVPEPSTFTLIAPAAFALVVGHRRRSRKLRADALA